jgi:hypothetical protein
MAEFGRLEYGNSKNWISKFFRLQAFDIPESRQKNICGNLERQISRNCKMSTCSSAVEVQIRAGAIGGDPPAVAETGAIAKSAQALSRFDHSRTRSVAHARYGPGPAAEVSPADLSASEGRGIKSR